LLSDQAAQLIVALEYLEHAEPAAIAGAAAALAADGCMNGVAGREAERRKARIVRKVRPAENLPRPAALAELAHQALRDHRAQGRAQQIGLDAEVEQAR